MENESAKRRGAPGPPGTGTSDRPAPSYEPPRILKKRSVARVTLFSGGGVSAGGLTASG
ncbi:MAG: hypothetical protein HY901_10590 [Deltaproteobacteria bacterium]|nr:hypothetical protein [Deltaproteobacteria bacterium]